MELNTYTTLWAVERKLFKIYDWTLPFPLGFRQIGVGGGFAVVWVFLLSKLGVPFHAPWHVVYLGPPGVLGWLAGKPVAEGKTLGGLVASQVRYWVAQPKTLTRLATNRAPKLAWISGTVWRDTTPRQAPPISLASKKRSDAKSRPPAAPKVARAA